MLKKSWKCHQIWYVIKTEILPKLKCHQNWYVTKMELSPKLKCHQNWNVTKTEMSPKLKCHKNWKVNKTKMLPKLKCHKIEKCHKNSNLNQNQIPGDQHWSPWSCLMLFFDKVVKLVCGGHTPSTHGQNRVWYISAGNELEF